jgi:hypothetical protein
MDIGLTPQQKQQIARDVHDIHRALDRNAIIFKKRSEEDCPDCDINPRTGESTDPMCPTCDGEGKVYSWKQSQVVGVIKWITTTDIYRDRAGILEKGDCRLSMHPAYATQFEVGDHLLVDDIPVEVKEITKAGIGQVNRIFVECKRITDQEVS